jgi:L-2-hydroxyglutarate oxidase LhgO
MEKTAIVIGCGVIGVACSRQLARCGFEVYALERHSSIGSEISSRNSEVIHAGIYYNSNSAKANLCTSGRK